MLKIATKTKLSPEEAIKRAVEFFGPGGYGLEVKEQSFDCAYFEGGGERREPPWNWNPGNGIFKSRNSFARFTDSMLEASKIFLPRKRIIKER